MLSNLTRLFVVGLVITLAACGPKNKAAPAKVSGVVTYKGEALQSGNISFHSKDGKSSSYQSSLGTDGSYSVFEMPVGEMDVTVETESLNPKRTVPVYGAGKGGKGKGGADQQRAMMGAPDAKGLAERWKAIPKRYSDPKTSKLGANIVAGSQTVNFELTD